MWHLPDPGRSHPPVHHGFLLRAPAAGLFHGRREASETLRRVDGQSGPQLVRFSIGHRTSRHRASTSARSSVRVPLSPCDSGIVCPITARTRGTASGQEQILSFHGRNVTQPVGCSAGALEARTAVQRRGNRTVRWFPCGRAGDSCESPRNRTRLSTILGVLLGRPVACTEPGSAMLSRLAVQ